MSVLLMKYFADCALPTPPGPTPLWGPGSVPNNWVDVGCFLKPPLSQKYWKVTKYGASSIPRQALGLRANDQSCHHETWMHLHFVDWSNQWNHQVYYNGNILLRERPTNFGSRALKGNICEVLSDNSLSSQLYDHSYSVPSRRHSTVSRSMRSMCSSSPSDLTNTRLDCSCSRDMFIPL